MKVTCVFCGSFNLQYIGWTESSNRKVEVGFFSFGKIKYERRKLISLHECRNCCRLTEYHIGKTK